MIILLNENQLSYRCARSWLTWNSAILMRLRYVLNDVLGYTRALEDRVMANMYNL
jgi:hypothetical protein